MGLKENLDLDDEPEPASFWRRWFVGIACTAATAVPLGIELLANPIARRSV